MTSPARGLLHTRRMMTDSRAYFKTPDRALVERGAAAARREEAEYSTYSNDEQRSGRGPQPPGRRGASFETGSRALAQLAWLTFGLCAACGPGPSLRDDSGNSGSPGAGTGGADGTLNSGGIAGTSTGTVTGYGGSVGGVGGDSAGASSTGGTSGSGGVMAAGSTGTGGSAGACGDPAMKALFAACAATQDAASCSDRGGHWRVFGAGNPGGACVCPTGEGGCPCYASSDCLGSCTAWLDPFDSSSCDRVTSFTCTSTHVAEASGCWCRPEKPIMAVCFP